jgi:hypothetical protein
MTAGPGSPATGAGSCPGFAADSGGLTLIPLNMAELDHAGAGRPRMASALRLTGLGAMPAGPLTSGRSASAPTRRSSKSRPLASSPEQFDDAVEIDSQPALLSFSLAPSTLSFSAVMPFTSVMLSLHHFLLLLNCLFFFAFVEIHISHILHFISLCTQQDIGTNEIGERPAGPAPL